MTRASAKFVIPLVILGVLASGCRPGERTGAPTSPVRGGSLVVAIGRIDLSNPGTTVGSSKTRSTMLIYQGLLSVGENLEPRADLAESFEAENDGAVWRFRLRNTRWHDGKPFTSEDVKFTFEKVLLEFHPRTRQVLKPKLSSIDTPDDRTVVFRLNAPFSAFPFLLTVGDAPILPRHIFDGTDPNTNPANEKPVGTGPFKFQSYKPEDELRLVRNRDYFRQGLPYLNEVILRAIPNKSTALQAMERGDIDLVIAPSAADIERLKKDPEFSVVVNSVEPVGAACSELFGFNLDRPMFADPTLRRAIAHGIDRQRFDDQLRFGHARAHSSPMNSGIEWAHANVDYPKFDREEADRLLTEAGWVMEAGGTRIAKGTAGLPDGTPLSFSLAASDDHVKFGEIIREELGHLGIDVAVLEEDSDLSEQRIFEKRDFDTYQDTSCQGVDPEVGLRRTIHSSAVTPIAATNGAGYRNPEIDTLMDRAAAELDRQERANLYRRVQEILAREMPYIWLLEDVNLFVYTRACVGFRFDSADLADQAYCRL